MKKGFTLIELLIVIAIIAILALIAVPNFLEAQVRAKVSRVNADMRSLSVAIEAYAVDWGEYRFGYEPIWKVPAFDSLRTQIGTATDVNLWCLTAFTTPVAYIGTVLHDPFVPDGERTTRKEFYYNTFYPGGVYGGFFMNNRCKFTSGSGYVWALQSFGPSKDAPGPASFSWFIGTTGDINERPPYDSSNGTMSLGIIVRTNRGAWTEPKHYPEYGVR